MNSSKYMDCNKTVYKLGLRKSEKSKKINNNQKSIISHHFRHMHASVVIDARICTLILF